MAYKFQLGAARLSGSLVQEGNLEAQGSGEFASLKIADDGTIGTPGDADMITLDAGSDITIASDLDFIVAEGKLKIGATAMTSTAAELNLLDGVSGLVQADFTKLAAIDATAAEINYLDNDDLTAADITKLAAVDASAAEINLLDNVARGSIIHGNASGASALLGKGDADSFLQSDGADISYVTMSGDATLSAGVLSIGATKITDAMINNDVATELASGNGIGASDGVLSVSGGDGITAEANGVKVTPAQTTITSVLNAALTVGRDSDNVVDFATDNMIKFKTDGAERMSIDSTGNVIIEGGLTVNGTTTTVNSTTVQIDDLNLQLADGNAAASAVNGGGITLATSGDDFTFAYNHGSTAWKSNIDMDLANNKLLKINGAEVLSAAGSVKVQSAVAGNGLAHSSGVLSVGVDGAGIEIASDALQLVDGGVTAAKMVNLTATKLYVGNASNRPVAVSLSGDVTMSNAGLVTIEATAVEAGMLNANVISGQTELASGLASTDELMVSDDGTLKRMDMSVLSSFIGTNIAADIQNVAGAGTLVVGVNYFSDMSADGEDVVTLPASPSVGQSVKVKAPSDCSFARFITINKAGSQTIDGETSIRLESPFAAVEMVYVANNEWRVF